MIDIDTLSKFFLFILGACVGSFLNVCIARWPKDRSVVRPGSACPQCAHPIRWHDNIPLISWFLLRGKCRDCGAAFSIRYPAIELLTALVFLATYHGWGLSWLLIPYLVLFSGFIVAFFTDIDERIIPDEVSLGGTVAGLLLSVLIPSLHHTDSGWLAFQAAGLGALAGGGAIYAMGMIGEWIFRKEAMGGGDVKLMAMIGAFLGWETAVLTFFIAPFFGAVVGIVEKIRTKDSTIAYGPHLIAAALVALFWGGTIIDFIVSGRLYGL